MVTRLIGRRFWTRLMVLLLSCALVTIGLNLGNTASATSNSERFEEIIEANPFFEYAPGTRNLATVQSCGDVSVVPLTGQLIRMVNVFDHATGAVVPMLHSDPLDPQTTALCLLANEASTHLRELVEEVEGAPEADRTNLFLDGFLVLFGAQLVIATMLLAETARATPPSITLYMAYVLAAATALIGFLIIETYVAEVMDSFFDNETRAQDAFLRRMCFSADGCVIVEFH